MLYFHLQRFVLLSILVDGSDYVGGSFTAVLSVGESQTCLNIPIVDDSDAEGTETFSIFLINMDPGVDSGASMSTVQIMDDDSEFQS